MLRLASEFSLSPLFRRKWPSIYEALEDSRPNREKMMGLYLKQMPSQEQLLVAIDHSPWLRPEAKTLRERTYEHQPGASKKVGVGQGYSTIAWIPEEKGSWALPLRHERISSWESPLSKAVWQVKEVCKHLNQRILLLIDREYANASWVKATIGLEVDSLMKLRSNLCFWSAPPAY